MDNQEHVLVPVKSVRDELSGTMTVTEPGVVMMIWTDENETPLEAIGRLNQEVLDAQGSGELADIARRALDSVRDAISEIEQVGSYVGSLESAVTDVESLLASAQDELENADVS